MSVLVMSRVWADAEIESRIELLVLLALADNANDAGLCYPSLDRICSKSRCSIRTVQDTFKSLVDKGKLVIAYNNGPNGTNVYEVLPPANAAPPQTPHPADLRRESAPEPSGTINPLYLEIQEVWNSHPKFQKSLKLSPSRKSALNARSKDRFFMENWRPAIERLSKSNFACGYNERGWRASLDWFIKGSTVVKIMEGTYDNKTPWQKPKEPPRTNREIVLAQARPTVDDPHRVAMTSRTAEQIIATLDFIKNR